MKRAAGDERGVAAVEFALVATLLFTLIFGIIIFGVIFGYRQQLTQATAEGARAAVAVPYTPSSYLAVQEAARNQVNRSLSSLKRACPAPGSTDTIATVGIACTFVLYPCAAAPTSGAPPTGVDDCLQVQATLDLKTPIGVGGAAKPLAPPVPFISFAVPQTMTGTYVVRLSGGASS